MVEINLNANLIVYLCTYYIQRVPKKSMQQKENIS